MSDEGQNGLPELLKRRPYLALALVAVLVLIIWYAIPGPRLAPVGMACESKHACESGICLPDADQAQVDRLAELTRAYEQGQRANPALAGDINELLLKLPRSSLTLRPIYPGVCTQPCTYEADCPEGMFCMEAVWMGIIKGLDRGRVQVCMPEEHPAAQLVRPRQ